MRGTTGAAVNIDNDPRRISIHVPREGDDSIAAQKLGERDISIHVPREGDDCGISESP